MGHPRRLKSKTPRPKKPWDKARIEEDKKLMKEYGLRRKRELWRLRDILRQFRRRARELAAKTDELKFNQLMTKLRNLNLVDENSTIDTVLRLDIRDLLERRLQTIVYRKGLARTIKQARQFIVHGHVKVNGKVMPYPSYLVRKGEETSIELSPKLSRYVSKEVNEGEENGKE